MPISMLKEKTISDLAAVWHTEEISVVLPGMAGFVHSPSLGNKIRGALGHVLLASASLLVRNRKKCLWRRPSTLELFFRNSGFLQLGEFSSEIAHPFVFSTYGRTDGSLEVNMRIFGSACSRASSICDALIAALCHAVDWQQMLKDAPGFLPTAIEPSDVRHVRGQLDLPSAEHDSDDIWEMLFLSPLDCERGNPVDNPGLILLRLVRRLALLAPWFSISLAESYPDLVHEAEQALAQCEYASAGSYSVKGGHRFSNQLVVSPVFSVSNVSPSLAVALVLGEKTHIGRGANLGLGRYRLVRPDCSSLDEI